MPSRTLILKHTNKLGYSLHTDTPYSNVKYYKRQFFARLYFLQKFNRIQHMVYHMYRGSLRTTTFLKRCYKSSNPLFLKEIFLNGVTSNQSHFLFYQYHAIRRPKHGDNPSCFFIFTPGKNFRPSFLFRINKDCIFKIMFLLISYYSFSGCQNYFHFLCFILFIHLFIYLFSLILIKVFLI